MTDDNLNRILTLQIQIIEPHRATWIWDNRMDNLTQYGIRIHAIVEGPLPPMFPPENHTT